MISGGTGNNQGSVSLLFRSLTGAANAKRYLLCQRGAAGATSNEFGIYFDGAGLNVQIGSQTSVILSNAIAFGAWYYLAISWDETRPSTNGAEVTWYLGRVGGTLTNGSINITDTVVVGSTNTVYLGCRRNDNNSWSTFRSPGNGALDQVAFWNTELTAGEITAQFNALPPGWLPANFNWELMVPVNEAGQLVPNDPPHVVEHAPLVSAFQFVDCTKKYFYRGDSNTMVFEAPWNGADTDTSSNSPRSELRETLANGNEFNWKPYDPATGAATNTHTLQATCWLESMPSKVIFGQIHAETPVPTNGAVPAVTLFHEGSGTANKRIRLAVYYSPDRSVTNGGNQDQTFDLLSGVNVGDRIDYELKLVGTSNSTVTLTATVATNGGPVFTNTFPMTSGGFSGWAATNVTLYFKAGCYYPKAATNSGTARVTFSGLGVTHQP